MRIRFGMRAAVCLVIAGCASTTVTVTPSPQAPVCDARAAALVLWALEWRADQKDVPDREAAAASGLDEFFRRSGCFARTELRRVPDVARESVSSQVAGASDVGSFDLVVTIAVRELGPVVKLLASPALVDGGTEVVLQTSVYVPPDSAQPRTFTIHWQNGGPGVVKGVASLPGDIQEALAAGMLRGTVVPP